MDKKGAIEFSMTTIMVVIIGVAVLALGLAWIRGTFSQVGDITEGSLEAAEVIVGEVAFSGKISAPAVINMGGTDVKKFRTLVRNTATTAGDRTFTATASEAADSGNCLTVSPTTLGSVKVGVDEISEFGGGVTANGCASGDTGIVRVEIKEGATNVYATDTIAVRIN